MSERERQSWDRRRFRDLLNASSLGVPGVKARIRRDQGHALTPDEEAAAAADERELDRALSARRRRRQDP